MSAEHPANYCTTCGQDFAYLTAFDEHHIGSHDYTYVEGIDMDPPREDGRRCLDSDEMRALGWSLDRWGRWKSTTQVRELERVQL